MTKDYGANDFESTEIHLIDFSETIPKSEVEIKEHDVFEDLYQK